MSEHNITQLPENKIKTVVRINKNRDFLQVSHVPLYDRRLSLKAKGLHCIMLSMADGWEFRREHLLTLCADGRDGLNTAIKELQSLGYVSLNSERDARGRIQKWVMAVYEIPPTTACRTDSPEYGFSVSGQNPATSTPVADSPEYGFSRSGKPACNNIDHENNINTNNNNSNVVVDICKRLPNLFVDDALIVAWIDQYGEAYVLEKVGMAETDKGINDVNRWLPKAIRHDYKPTPTQTYAGAPKQPTSAPQPRIPAAADVGQAQVDRVTKRKAAVAYLDGRGKTDPRLSGSMDYDEWNRYEDLVSATMQAL